MTVEVKGSSITAGLLFWHALFGAGYLLGGPRVTSAGGFRYALAVTDGHTWGLLLLAGLLPTVVAPWLDWRWSAALHGVGAAPFVVMASCVGYAELSGASQGVGGTFLSLGPCIAHVLLVRGRYRQVHPQPVRTATTGAPCST